MARTEEQNEKMRETRKESIRAAALEQFALKGLFATRIGDIAKSAGMAQGLLYHYYPSKDAIYIDLVDEALEKLIEASAHVRGMDAPAEEKINFALRELLQTIKTSARFSQTCRFIAQAMNSTAIPAEAQRLLDEKRDIPYQHIEQVMKDGQTEGSVIDGDARTLSVLFWTTVNGLAIYHATRPGFDELPDYRLIAGMFLREPKGKGDLL